jgi:hypothetical protein
MDNSMDRCHLVESDYVATLTQELCVGKVRGVEECEERIVPGSGTDLPREGALLNVHTVVDWLLRALVSPDL